MAWKVDQLTDKILRLMSPEDRKSFGKAGMTAEEALFKAKAKSERDLQKLIISYLGLKGIVPIWARMDKKTTTPLGTMDLLFAVRVEVAHACAWEVKMPGEEMTDEQKLMAVKMSTEPNAWEWNIVTSLDQAKSLLNAMGIE